MGTEGRRPTCRSFGLVHEAEHEGICDATYPYAYERGIEFIDATRLGGEVVGWVWSKVRELPFKNV